jgi:hypothetical protein
LANLGQKEKGTGGNAETYMNVAEADRATA